MANDFKYSLLENGLDFLLSSLDHLTLASAPQTPVSGPEAHLKSQKHDLKYALLHLCSSIELIFKQRLNQEHWSLVFKDLTRASKDAYELGDFQSVSFQEAQERLVGICGVEFEPEQARDLRNVRDRRNKVEHFGALDTLPAVQASVTKMVNFLVDFVEQAFGQDALAAEQDLIAAIRSRLGNCNAFVIHRWGQIQAEIKGLRSTVACPACQQKALNADGGTAKCLFCNYEKDAEGAANDFVSNVLGWTSRFLVKRHGGVWPVTACPECGADTLVTGISGPGDPENDYYCFSCGQQYSMGQLAPCAECGALFEFDDDEARICPGCWAAKVASD